MRSREQALALAEKNVQQREEGCDVSSAQALHMVSEMQREVLETRVSIKDNEKLKAKLKAQQEQNRLLRLEAESARPPEVTLHEHSTRLSTSMMSDNAAMSTTNKERESAESVLRVASAAVQKWDGSTWPLSLEVLQRHLPPSLDWIACGPSIALAQTVIAATAVLGQEATVAVVERLIPSAFIKYAGSVMNQNVRLFAASRHTSPWRRIWDDEAPTSFVLFSDVLFGGSRRSDNREESAYRDNQLFCRQMSLLAQLSYTYNQSRREMLQDDLALGIGGACSRTELQLVCSSIGVATPRSTAVGKIEENREKDNRIFEGILGVWLSLGFYFKIIFDNLDVRDVHALLGIVTLGNPHDPRDAVDPRLLICEQTRQSLLTVRPRESRAKLVQVLCRASEGLAAARDGSQNILVENLALKEEETTARLRMLEEIRVATKRGRKPETALDEEDDLCVVRVAYNTESFGTLNVGEHVRVLFRSDDAKLAVVRVPGRDEAVYVPLSVISGRAADVSTSSPSIFKRADLKNRARQWSRFDAVDSALQRPLDNAHESRACLSIHNVPMELDGPSVAAMSMPETFAAALERQDALSAWDSKVVKGCADWAISNTDLPEPSLSATLLFLGLEDVRASDRAGVFFATRIWEEKIKKAVSHNGRSAADIMFTHATDGQEYLMEHKFRDGLRKTIQDDIHRISSALQQHEIPIERRNGLEASKRKRTDDLNAVDSMTVHELVLMHWEFTICRALFKADGDFFWEVIIERTGLSHISNGLRECRAGFLDRLVSLFRAASTAWYAEMACLGLELGHDVSDENHLLEFINSTRKVSETANIYHRVVVKNPAGLLDVHRAGTMRASPAKDLILPSLREGVPLTALGGCPQYCLNGMYELRQWDACPRNVCEMLYANPTTAERDTRSSLDESGGVSVYHNDYCIENRGILRVKNSNRNLHQSSVQSTGETLNLDAATAARLRRNMFPEKDGRPERSHSERLSQKDLVISIRAAIRSSPIVARIRSDIMRPQTMATHPFTVNDIPIISSLTSRGESQIRNPEYLKSEQVGRERAEEHATFALRSSIGGQYNFAGRMRYHPILSFFLKTKAESMRRVTTSRNQLFAALAVLGRNSASITVLRFPAMLAQQVGGRVVLNPAPKSKIRTVLRQVFNIGKATSWMEIAGEPCAVGSKVSRFVLARWDHSESVVAHTIVLDVAMLMRRLPHPAPGDKTGLALILLVLKSTVGSRLAAGAACVEYVEDIRNCFYKMLTEQKRNARVATKPDTLVSFSLGVIPGRVGPSLLSSVYADRDGGRRQFQAAVAEVVTNSSRLYDGELTRSLGTSGVVVFSGIGSDADSRSRSLSVDLATGAQVWGEPSNLLEDTNAANKVYAAILRGDSSVLVGEDGDFVLILALVLGVALFGWCGIDSRPAATLGYAFVHMSPQDIQGSDGQEHSTEEYICCNELAQAMYDHIGLVSMETTHRVPSVIACLIFLGGDTTPYLYMPYNFALGFYLQHCAFVGSLVRIPDQTEREAGWRVCINVDAMVRLTMLLYAAKNPLAISGFLSMTPTSRAAALSEVTYSGMEQRVARLQYPRITKLMPSLENLGIVCKLTQARLDSWMRAIDPSAEIPPRIGLRVYLRNGLVSPDAALIQVDEPTSRRLSELATQGLIVDSVEPLINRLNTPLSELFPESGAPSVSDIMRGVTVYESMGSSSKVKFCGKCHHAHKKGTMCAACGSINCVDTCLCGHAPHGKNRCLQCGPFVGRARCVPKCPLCLHPGQRAVHTRTGCSECPSPGGPCCRSEATGNVTDDVTGVENEPEEDEDDDEAVLQETLAAAVEAGGEEAEAAIMAVEAATGNDEIEMLLADQTMADPQ
jgi:hypothetical protein